jgi:lactoylglutathione lyase
MIILYVGLQERSKLFYQTILQKKPVLDVPGMTEFILTDNFKLGLMPEKGIAKILVPHTAHPESGNGIPRCELYLFVDNPSEALQNAVSAGANEISKAEIRDWGDLVAYCADPDGHIIAFAK